MPLHINLLTEAQAAEELRRKDPVKRVALIAAGVVAAVALWCGQKQAQLVMARSELAAMSANWTSKEKNFQQVTETLRAVGDVEAKLNSLVRVSTNRFLWGTALHQLQLSLPPDIVFTRLRSEQAFSITAAEPPKKSGAKLMPGKPAFSTERLQVVIDGKDYAPQEAQNYNRFKVALGTNTLFGPMLAPVGGFKLSNLSQPVGDPLNGGRVCVAFSLETRFPEMMRDE